MCRRPRNCPLVGGHGEAYIAPSLMLTAVRAHRQPEETFMSQPLRPETGVVQRRALFAGATTVGALAAVASLLPSGPNQAPVAEPQLKEPPQRGGGYALTDHVKQYYQTTRV